MISTRCGVLAKTLLAAYVLAAALLPLAHHDALCHLKSSTHCTSCAVGSSGETAASAIPLEGLCLPDAGQTVLANSVHRQSAPVQNSSGRSPPLV
jgi:hypothetical protein